MLFDSEVDRRGGDVLLEVMEAAEDWVSQILRVTALGPRAVAVGSVEVRPGDMLVGDVDGVVCVPSAVAEDVLEGAEAKADTEDEVREAVREGMAPLDAYHEFGAF